MDEVMKRAQRLYSAFLAFTQLKPGLPWLIISTSRLRDLVSLLSSHVVNGVIEDPDIVVDILDEVYSYATKIEDASVIHLVQDFVSYHKTFDAIAQIESEDPLVQNAVQRAAAARNFVYAKLELIANQNLKSILAALP